MRRLRPSNHPAETESEADLGNGRTLRFHRRCLTAWQEEIGRRAELTDQKYPLDRWWIDHVGDPFEALFIPASLAERRVVLSRRRDPLTRSR